MRYSLCVEIQSRDLFLDKAKNGNMSMTLTISIWVLYLIDATCSTVKFITCLYGKQIKTIHLYVDFVVVGFVLALVVFSQIKSDKQCVCSRAHVQKCHLINRIVTNMQIPIKKNSICTYNVQDMRSIRIISVTFQNCQDYLWMWHILSGKRLN